MKTFKIKPLFRTFFSVSRFCFLRPSKFSSKIGFFLTFSGLFAYVSKNQSSFFMIEDEVVLKARKSVSKKLDEFRREFGTQMMSFPETFIGIRGGCYFMEFLVDQRKCDLFSLLMVVLDLFEKNKENNRIVVKSMNSFKQDSIITLQVDFEECAETKSSKPYNYCNFS